jgi:amino-acid N-acetyltransferase
MSIATAAVIRIATSDDFDAVVRLLKTDSLPTNDLLPSLSHFFVAEDKNEVVGVIGLEMFKENGLLRSMVVDRSHRKQALAATLLDTLLKYAADKHVEKLFLITTTAEEYFSRKGFSAISREAVPSTIRTCSQFTSLCPSTATVMKKDIQAV